MLCFLSRFPPSLLEHYLFSYKPKNIPPTRHQLMVADDCFTYTEKPRLYGLGGTGPVADKADLLFHFISTYKYKNTLTFFFG